VVGLERSRHSGDGWLVHLVPGPVAGGRPVGVVRTAIVRVIRVRVEAEPVEVLEALTALEPLAAAVELVAAVKTAMKSVSTIPGQRWARHRAQQEEIRVPAGGTFLWGRRGPSMARATTITTAPEACRSEPVPRRGSSRTGKAYHAAGRRSWSLPHFPAARTTVVAPAVTWRSSIRRGARRVPEPAAMARAKRRSRAGRNGRSASSTTT
jgi:hypothetical protein